MTPVCVPPAHVHRFWPHASALVKSAIVRGGLSDFAAIERAVLSGEMFLWVAWDRHRIAAAVVTQLTGTGAAKTGTIVACAGRGLKRYEHLRSVLEDHFRSEGCSRVRVMGRPGWLRKLTDYSLKAIVLEKKL
jgi:hypothetical protein